MGLAPSHHIGVVSVLDGISLGGEGAVGHPQIVTDLVSKDGGRDESTG